MVKTFHFFKTFKHPIYKDVETFIVCTKLAAKDINEDFYAREKGEEFVSKAIHSQANQKNYVPVIDEVGQVAKTGFMNELKLKVGSKVMLIHNIDVDAALVFFSATRTTTSWTLAPTTRPHFDFS